MKPARAALVVRRAAAAAALSLLAALPAHPQTATLVDDLNPGAWESAPPRARGLFAAAGKLFFSGGEDGEPAVAGAAGTGTTLLADLCGECGSSPAFLGNLGNVALFVANGTTPNGLYRTDGTRAGTFSLGVSSGKGVFAGNLFFFLHCLPTGLCELWKTDGTVAGTGRVRDFGSGAAAFPRIDVLTAVGRRIFFFVDLAVSVELWASDGTAAGTTRVLAFPSRPSVSTRAGGSSRFYFLSQMAPDPVEQLWVSDGTAAGTLPVTRFQNPAPFAESTLRVLGDTAYVVANDVVHGNELWASDGTPAGTRRVTDFGYFTPFTTLPDFSLLALGNRLVFPASDGLHGTQLWATSGTPASTTVLGTAQIRGTQLLPVAGGRAVFRVAKDEGGDELWETDGTPEGTQRLPAPCCTLDPRNAGIFALLGRAYFVVEDIHGDAFLGSTDGTPAGTRRFSDPLPDGAEIGEVAAVPGRLFFTVALPGEETRLWTSDGRPGGTRPVPGLLAGGSSDPFDFVPLPGGELAFIACDGEDRQVFRTAGTPATTARLSDFNSLVHECGVGGPVGLTATPIHLFVWFENEVIEEELWSVSPSGGAERLANVGFLGGDIPRLVPLGDRVYFVFQTEGDDAPQLWQSDGTTAGTGPATALAAVPSPSRVDRAGGTLYVQGSSAAGRELWASDGTAAGTRRLLVVPQSAFFLQLFAQAGPWTFFFAQTSDFHTDLWRTDGTAAGTTLVRDVTPTPFTNASPTDPVALSGVLYFFNNTATGRALFRSDGTAAGTFPLREFRPESDAFSQVVPAWLTVFAGRLFFAANDGVSGRELWSSDGTAAGTARIADVNPGPGSSRAAELTVVGGRLFFSAYDPVHGSELWQSDGTAGGTRLAADLAPESASSFPRHLTASGSRLYFTADDGISGNEPWTIDTGNPGTCQPTDTRLCLSGGRFQVEVDWKDFQGHTGVGHAVPLTADTGTFWFFASSNVELVIKVLDGRGLNQAFWVFYGALSSVDYTITVTDTATGLSRRYHNPSGQLASVGDTDGFGPLGAFDAKMFEAPPSALPLVSARTDPRAATGRCAPDAQRLCLQGNRFAVTTAWKDFSGHTGTGTAVSLTGDTGYFWFFSSTNVEVVAKVLDGRPVNDKFWLFYGALSNVEYTLTVTDTQTGAVKTYRNPSGQFGSVADTGAF